MPGWEESVIFRFQPLATIAVPTGIRIDVVAAATAGGTVPPDMFVFLWRYAENVNPKPPAVPSEILRPPRLRGTDYLVEERQQLSEFFPVQHRHLRSGRLLRHQEYFGNFGRNDQGSFTRGSSGRRRRSGRGSLPPVFHQPANVRCASRYFLDRAVGRSSPES